MTATRWISSPSTPITPAGGFMGARAAAGRAANQWVGQGLHGREGPAPVRRFLPHLMDLVVERKIDPGKVFDLELPLSDVAEGYRAMDERRAIKVLLRI